MKYSFEGKVAVVTGASIGEKLASGASIIVVITGPRMTESLMTEVALAHLGPKLVTRGAW